jgi:hypothetical protein
MELAVRVEPTWGRRYRSLLRRADGVLVAFEGGSYNHIGGPHRDVPHDIAHLVVERALGLDRGVWGLLAAGGLFGAVTIEAGRQKPHATARGKALVKAAHAEVMDAELLTRAVCDWTLDPVAPAELRRGLGDSPAGARLTGAVLERCRAELADAAARWARLEPGAGVELTWPT